MEVDIYTDCGGTNADLGIGIHLITSDDVERSFMIKTSAQEVNKRYGIKTNLLVGEVHAVLKALELLEGNITKVRVFTDSDMTFFILNKLYSNIKRKKNFGNFEILNREFLKLKSKFEIDVMWIKGHAGVYGNELSDLLSGKALRKSVKKDILYEVEIPVKKQPVKHIKKQTKISI